MSGPSYADNEELAALLLDEEKKTGVDFVIIDVRDDDFKGGNIPGAVNVPAHTLLDKMPHIIEKYAHVPVIYFHCALSQVRGPKSARIYKESLDLQGIVTNQKIKILSGGFDDWREKYPKLIMNLDD